MKTNDPTINLEIDGRKLSVPRSAYIKAKLKQLSEFGYNGLTEQVVSDQLDKVLAKKDFANGLTVIGGFMKDEVIP